MAGSYNSVINLYIGELEFLNCTENMVSIDHVRVADSVSESTVIEVYDDTALVVDAAIASTEGGKISFEYGYANGVMSDRYEANITKYGTNFIGFSTICTIEAQSTGVVGATANANSDSVSSGGSGTNTKKKYSGTISEIVYQVASEEKWNIGKIETTKIDDVFEITRNGESANDFIDSLVSKAVSENSESKGKYNFFLKSTGSVNTIYFTTQTEEELDDSTSTEKGENEDKKDEAINPYEYQYVLGMPNDSIISFEPQYNDVLTALIGAASVKGTAMDPDTNEEVSVEVKDEEAIVKLEKSAGSSVANIVRHVAGNAYTYTDLKTLAQTMHSVATSLMYPATLVLKGKPRIMPNTKISILVLTRAGQKHHSSGDYLITSVEDLVENAVYTTTLSLYKNIDDISQIIGSNGGFGGIGSGGISSFTKYNYSESDYQTIAACCENENPGVEGVAAEASLMCNRFELYGSSYNNILAHVAGGSFFAGSTKRIAANGGSASSTSVEVVKKVVQQGMRTIPAYVDEHDCFSDISSISTGSVYSRSDYKQHQTKVYNKYSSVYTFYCFPNSQSDPFGYTSDTNRNKLGEFHYDNNWNPVGMPSGSANAGAVEEKLKKYLGTPYVWGGESFEEGGFDCSGFVWAFLKNEMGSTAIGGRDTAEGLSNRGTPVNFDSSYSQLKTCDLLFPSGLGHVVMWIGNGRIVHSPHTGDVIKYADLWFTPVKVRRYL